MQRGRFRRKWWPTGEGRNHAVRKMFERHRGAADAAMAVTGEAAKALVERPYRAGAECLEKALAFHGLSPHILLTLGGETFSVYCLKDGQVRSVSSTTKCAAGTGEFIVQQFARMGLPLEEGLRQCADGRIVPLATRCSVHCKSDATHKLNKGECVPAAVTRSLVHDMAVKVRELVTGTRWPKGSVVLAGGLSQNRPFVQDLAKLLPDSEIVVLPESPCPKAPAWRHLAQLFMPGSYRGHTDRLRGSRLSKSPAPLSAPSPRPRKIGGWGWEAITRGG